MAGETTAGPEAGQPAPPWGSHTEVTGLATPGDVRLLPLLIQAERRRPATGPAAAETVLAGATDYSSSFIHIPF